MRRFVSPLVVLVLAASISFADPAATPVAATPVATSDGAYEVMGRVFPDPHGCVAGAPGHSPWAKGNVCAVQFVQWDEALEGLGFLQEKFPRYLQVLNLRTLLEDDPRFLEEELQSAGLPAEDFSRLRRDLHVIKVTDRRSPVPEAARKHFAVSLSIHGIERAGLEGGIRAIEDLVTWAACEEDAEAAPACATDGTFPKKILEPTDSGPTAGQVLDHGVIYFMFSNPDGWHRGEWSEGGVFFQRYNGNGMDLNRDWPAIGYTEEQYTPASEPETRGYSKFFRSIRDRTRAGRFAGALDLHGMLTSHSFSFTLLGAGQHDYRKNKITVDTAITTFRDAEARLTWSPHLAPAGECPGPLPEPFFGRTQGPMCTDQWGTVWDTINYQVTGAVADWMDSPMGLNAVAINNEMALSHLTPNNVFDPHIEQLHIDGNKGLIYAQIASLLFEKPVRFRHPGRVGYVHDPSRIRNRGGRPSAGSARNLPPQEAIEGMEPTGGAGFEFEVQGPKDGVWNGGMTVEATSANARGISANHANDQPMILEYCGPPEHAGDPEGCREVARYFNQSGLYAQAGARIDLNDPRPGPYRVTSNPERPLPTSYRVTFSRTRTVPVPTQARYDASRMDFFRELNRYAASGGDRLSAVSVDSVLRDPARLRGLDSLVVAEEFMPGFRADGRGRYSRSQLRAYAGRLRRFVRGGGNLVLTDAALTGLAELGARIGRDDVERGVFFAGWIDFDDGEGPTYDRHPMAKGVDMEGTAEGQGEIGGTEFLHRHQTYEPGPIGYYISPEGSANAGCSVDRCDSPNWIVDLEAWEGAGGTVAGRTVVKASEDPEDETTSVGVSLGELRLGRGRVRIVGALLPHPTEKNYHPFGLASYALTYTGYQIFENAIAYRRP
ncbi:MAG: M14 family zinc carboxypeptidase [Actinomycetota bacterium]